jgi:hypothetical protein
MDKQQLMHPEINAFRSNHHPYYIFSLNYVQKSAGLRAYYYLCHILNELGYEAYVIADEPVVGLRTPILTYEIRQKHIAEGRHPIAVYGETTQGNPLCGDVVVRWMLNSVGRIGADITFNEGDLLYYWDEIFCPHDNPKILTVPVFDSEVFNADGTDETQRSGYCFYANKYFYFDKGVISDQVRNNGINITTENELTHIEIAEILRKVKVMFSYEESAICGEASLCGCFPVLLTNDCNKYLESLMNDSSCAMLCIYEKDIDFSLPYVNSADLLKLVALNYEQYAKINAKQLNDFINETQSSADNAERLSQYDEFIAFCQSNKNGVYLYGTGMLSPQCHQTLHSMGITVRGFIVTDGTDSYTFGYRGLPVTLLSEMKLDDEEIAIVLGMTMTHEEEVIPLLRERNFSNYCRYPLLTK